LFVILPLFKVSPYANKSKKIINICEESEQNTEQTLYSLEKINQLPKTAHLKVQN
jgi:hypothetical protein